MSIHVLVIDDDDASREGIEDSLRRMYAENPDLRQAVAGPEDGMGFLRAAEEAFGGE